jgi:hypothetical protein
MYCAKCGSQVDAGSSYCQKCGAAVDQPAVAQPVAATAPPMPRQAAAVNKTSSMAIASLVLGIVSIIINPLFLFSILAIIFGVSGISQVNKSNGAIKGKGMAVSGLILGIISIALMVLVIALVGFSMTWFSELGNQF